MTSSISVGSSDRRSPSTVSISGLPANFFLLVRRNIFLKKYQNLINFIRTANQQLLCSSNETCSLTKIIIEIYVIRHAKQYFLAHTPKTCWINKTRGKLFYPKYQPIFTSMSRRNIGIEGNRNGYPDCQTLLFLIAAKTRVYSHFCSSTNATENKGNFNYPVCQPIFTIPTY
jgi:hypothetical protein